MDNSSSFSIIKEKISTTDKSIKSVSEEVAKDKIISAEAIKLLTSKIDRLEIDYVELHNTIGDKDKEISRLKTDVLDVLAKIKDLSSNEIFAIEKFMVYELIGFDANNKSVWIRDADNNVLKVAKGTFIPEYGTAIDVLDDGSIVTKLGIVKTKID